MNKKMASAYRAYRLSDACNLWDVYGTFSREKARAFERCLDLMDRYGGRGLRIVGANTFTFSVGFEYEEPQTGVVMFCYHTANNTYHAEITPAEIH